MNKIFAVLACVLIIAGFTRAACWAGSCLGDFDCDGDVDGYNLTQFALNFGTVDCSSNPLPIQGTVEFYELGLTELYGFDFSATTSPEGIFSLKIKAGGLIQQLSLKALRKENIERVRLYLGDVIPGEEIFTLSSVRVLNISYDPPVQNNVPFISSVDLQVGALSFSPDCSAAPPSEIKFINTIGYSDPLNPDYSDYIPVNYFQLNIVTDESSPPAPSVVLPRPVKIESVNNYDSKCFGKWYFLGSHIQKITIEKFGSERPDGPEAKFELHDARFDTYEVKTSIANSLHSFTMTYDKIIWSLWEQDGSGLWQEYQNCYDFTIPGICPD